MSYIDNYIGEWEDKIRNQIVIRKIDAETAMVSYFTANDHKPINRPWCNGNPSIDMIAKYDPAWSPEIIVELCEDGQGFALHLNYEPDYLLDEAGSTALVPSLSRPEGDNFLDQYYHFFEPLKHYIKKSL